MNIDDHIAGLKAAAAVLYEESALLAAEARRIHERRTAIAAEVSLVEQSIDASKRYKAPVALHQSLAVEGGMDEGAVGIPGAA